MPQRDDPPEGHRGLLPSTLALALFPSPYLFGIAAVFLTRCDRLVFPDGRTIPRLTKMAAIAVATSTVMFTSSVAWFCLSKLLGPAATASRIPRPPALRYLANEAVHAALGLFVALLLAEAIRKILARRAEGGSAVSLFLSENAFRIGFFLSSVSVKATTHTMYGAISDGFYNIFKIIMIILLSSIYDFASIVVRAIRFCEILWTFPTYAWEIVADFLTVSLPDAFLWIPILTIWSAFLIAADVARRFANRITQSLIT